MKGGVFRPSQDIKSTPITSVMDLNVKRYVFPLKHMHNTHTHMYTHVMHTHNYACVYAYATHICTCMYTHMHAKVLTHTYMHIIYVHTLKNRHILFFRRMNVNNYLTMSTTV